MVQIAIIPNSKSFNQMLLKVDKACQGASSQVMPLILYCGRIMSSSVKISIKNISKRFSYYQTKKENNYFFRGLCLRDMFLMYGKIALYVRYSKKKTYTGKECNILNKYTSLAKTDRGQWKYQRYTEQNQPRNSQDISILWKLSRLLSSKYRYTSLELAVVQLDAALKVNPIANFHTSHPRKVGSRKSQKKKCHSIMAAPNYS